MSINTYELTIEDFAEKHYIKAFEKKYKKAWDITLSALRREFQSFDVLLQKSIAEVISDRGREVCICKVEFKISGTQESRHSSGNRCIDVLFHFIKTPRKYTYYSHTTRVIWVMGMKHSLGKLLYVRIIRSIGRLFKT